VILLLLLSGAAVFLIACASADTGITISADGSHSYYLGEKVILKGQNADSDSTYLFMTGPNLPTNGGNLTSPDQEVISGNPDSFTVVKTKADKTWEYSYYTANLNVSNGDYTIYAISQPKTKDQLGPNAANVQIILKKSFITAKISPLPVVKGQPFTVTGTASNNPSEIQIWMIGDTYGFTTKNPVHSDCSFNFTGFAVMSENLPAGQYYLFVQHPMANDQFDIVVSDDYYVTNRINNGTKLFRFAGAGHLQGSDAADALIKAFGDPMVEDTYIVIPFQVTDTGNLSDPAVLTTTAAAQQTTQPAPLRYAPIGTVLLIFGIIAWKRH
jgi:hypothetical protein